MKNIFKGAALAAMILFAFQTQAAQGIWQDNGVLLTAGAGTAVYPKSVEDGAGGVIIVGALMDVITQRVNSNGGRMWGDELVVCNASGMQRFPRIATDGAGGAIMLWQDFRNGKCDVYVQRVDGNGTALWAGNGVPLRNTTGSVYTDAAELTADGSGGAIAVWSDGRISSTNYDIYAQRIDAAGTIQWAGDGIAVCSAAGNQSTPQIIQDGAGGVIVAWQDNRSGNGDIYAQRINAAGSPLWAGNGVVICDTAGYQSYPVLAADNAGGAIIAWRDESSGNGDIYAQRVSAAGSVLWAGGRVICNTTAYQTAPQIKPDGSGGAIIAWEDVDIYTQRVDGSGNVLWINNGLPVCTAVNQQTEVKIFSNNDGGAMFAWTDKRSNGTDGDIYVQRVSGSGAVRWDLEGVAVCDAAGSQLYPQVVTDNGNGGIVTWLGTGSDVFAQRITRPKPVVSNIGTPAGQGVLHAYVSGTYFTDESGSVTMAKLVRAGQADIYFTPGTMNVQDNNNLTCDFDLTTAALGDWKLVLIDNYSQESQENVLLTIIPPLPTNTATCSSTSTMTETSTATASGTPTASPTNSMTSTYTSTATATPTSTVTPRDTGTSTATPSPTDTATNTSSPTKTVSPTVTVTATITPTSTSTATATSTLTDTNTATMTFTGTPTVSVTSTATSSHTSTETETVTASPTDTATPTDTGTITQTSTNTVTFTITNTFSTTATITRTFTHTGTSTITCTRTPTASITPTFSCTATRTRERYYPSAGQVIVYPSPAKGDRVVFYYFLPEPGSARIEIYNVLGETCAIIFEPRVQGYARTAWDIKNVGAGIYLYRVTLESQGAIKRHPLKKLVVVK